MEVKLNYWQEISDLLSGETPKSNVQKSATYNILNDSTAFGVLTDIENDTYADFILWNFTKYVINILNWTSYQL